MNRQVDIWGGIDGFAERWEGYLVSDTPDDRGRYTVVITDKAFLSGVGMDKPWKVSAEKLKDDYFVRYDDFAWSELGEVRPDDNGRLSPISVWNTPEPDPKHIEMVRLFEEGVNRALGNPK